MGTKEDTMSEDPTGRDYQEARSRKKTAGPASPTLTARERAVREEREAGGVSARRSTFNLRLGAKEKRLWELIARCHGRTLGNLIRHVMEEEVRKMSEMHRQGYKTGSFGSWSEAAKELRDLRAEMRCTPPPAAAPGGEAAKVLRKIRNRRNSL